MCMQRSEDSPWKWVLFHHVPGNISLRVSGSALTHAVSSVALDSIFIITVTAVQELFVKAWDFNYFLQSITEYSCKNTCHWALYSLYISKVWGLVYFDSILLLSPVRQVNSVSFTYCERTKRCLPISQCRVWWALHGEGIVVTGLFLWRALGVAPCFLGHSSCLVLLEMV